MKKEIELLTVLRKKQNKLKTVIARLEAEIIASVPDLELEGTTKTDWGSVTTKLTRKLDYTAYQVMVKREQIPEDLQFVSLQPKIELKKLRTIELVNPAFVECCVVIKPAKATIKIKEIVDELK